MATRQPKDETGARHVADVAPDDLAEIGRWCSADSRARERERASGRALRAFAPDIQSHRSLFDGARALAPRCSSHCNSHNGGIHEWPKGSDCKSDGNAFTGSNPVPATMLTAGDPSRPAVTPTRASRSALSGRSAHAFRVRRACGRSSVVERQPSKLNAWVRFPSPAPAPSMLAAREGLFRRCCSSAVEHFLGKEEVMGSIPISSSTLSSQTVSVTTRTIHLRAAHAHARRNDPPIQLFTAGSARRAAPSNP